MEIDTGALLGIVIVGTGFAWFFGSLATSVARLSRRQPPSFEAGRRRLWAFAVVFVGAALIVATRPMDAAVVAAIPFLVLAGLTVVLGLALRPRGPTPGA